MLEKYGLWRKEHLGHLLGRTLGLRDRGDVAELRAEEVKCCEASSRKDNRTVGLKGRGVFSVSLPQRSVSCLLRLFKGEGVRAGS